MVVLNLFMLRRYMPILGWLPAYRRTWLKDDAVAAFSVWALLIPQALALRDRVTR